MGGHSLGRASFERLLTSESPSRATRAAWLVDFRQRILVSLWFIPAIFAAAAIGAANLTVWLDSVVEAPVGSRPDLVSDQSAASSFAGAIAAATLAFVAVVFATTLVAIQLAASQYSPRTVRIFIRSRVTRITLGLFLATSVFALIMLVDNRYSLLRHQNSSLGSCRSRRCSR